MRAMEDEELCVAKSFSLKRNLIAGIRLRAAHLKMPMSAYVATLVHNDLVRGIGPPLSLSPWELPLYADPKPPRRAVSWSSSICRTNDLPPCFIHWPHERERTRVLGKDGFFPWQGLSIPVLMGRNFASAVCRLFFEGSDAGR
jgi:hypothetical protein